MKKINLFNIVLFSFCLFFIVSCSENDTIIEYRKGIKIEDRLHRHVAAIDQFVAEFDRYYIEVIDLYEQIQPQVNIENAAEDIVIYNVITRIHNLNNLSDYSNIYITPDYDLNIPDSTIFISEVKQAVSDGVSKYIFDNKIQHYIEVPLELSINDNENCKVSIINHSLTSLISVSDSILNNIINEVIDIEQETIMKLKIAEQKSELIEDIFDTSEYFNYVKIEDIKITSPNSGIITIFYPNPEEIYSKLAQDAVNAHNTPVFFSATVDLSSDNYFNNYGYINDFISSDIDIEWDMEFDPSNAYRAGHSAYDLFFEIRNIISRAASNALDEINEIWRIEPVDIPKTGVLTGRSSGNEVRIRTSADSGDYFLRFYKIPGTDYTVEGDLKLTVFIRGGERHTIRLPSGNYKLIYGTGYTWFGEEYMFGPVGRYNRFDSVIDSRNGYYIELTLYLVEGGNTGLTPVPFN